MATDKPLSPEASVFRGLEDTAGRDIPPPPYMLSGVNMIFNGVRFDKRAVREILPPELTPIEAHTGTYGIYTVDHGWGIAPWTAFFVAIEVKGFDSPDGSHGYYMATGYYSNRAGIVMRRDYNLNFLDGSARMNWEGSIAKGTGGPDGESAVAVQTRRVGEPLPSSSGIHHYLGRNSIGGLNFYAVAFSCDSVWNAQPISLTVSETDNSALQLLKPAEVLWALEFVDLSMTIGAPRPVVDGRAAMESATDRATVLAIFSRLGRAAIVVGLDGKVEFMNPEAEALLGGQMKVEGGRLRTVKGSNQVALDGIIAGAVKLGDPEFHLPTVALERPGGHSLLAQAMPIDKSVTDKPAVVLLFSDPASSPASDPVSTLQLLGLTPAEARVAALVGKGLSPRDTASSLGNSEATVRKCLIHIYQKLAIHRQSELARIVTRLESIGA